jgi:hypothetical protein
MPEQTVFAKLQMDPYLNAQSPSTLRWRLHVEPMNILRFEKVVGWNTPSFLLDSRRYRGDAWQRFP